MTSCRLSGRIAGTNPGAFGSTESNISIKAVRLPAHALAGLGQVAVHVAAAVHTTDAR